MGMKGVWAVPVIFVIALMLGFSILPAMALHPQGTIISINPAGTLGKIQKDHCVPDPILYVFRIPQDLSDSSYVPKVDDRVFFQINPDKSRHATGVTFGILPGSGCF